MTPRMVMDASTIRTDALQAMLPQCPLILDINDNGQSLPGATVLTISHPDTLDEAKQGWLRERIMALVDGDLARPIVVVGWNAEHWTPRNLVLRLMTMGCSHVHWYRGGNEVWMARNLPLVEAQSAE